MSDSTPVRLPRHRGIYLLPNLFTTGAMFAGFYAIIASIDGRFSEAAIAVFVAALLDGMDGRVVGPHGVAAPTSHVGEGEDAQPDTGDARPGPP